MRAAIFWPVASRVLVSHDLLQKRPGWKSSIFARRVDHKHHPSFLTMASSNGGGIGRFARRNTDAPTQAPPAPAPAANQGGEQPPASDFASFARGIASPNSKAFYSMDNVGMFGGSFDFDNNDYAPSDMDGFGMTPQKDNAGGSNDNDVVAEGDDSMMEQSAGTPVTSNKTTGGGGPFQFRNNQGTNPALHMSPPRPKTAVPPQQSGNGVSGLSMFARKRAAASHQEPTEKTAPVDSHVVASNNNNVQSSLKPTDASTANDSMADVQDSTNNNTESTFTRVLPPPSIAPSKPLQTQKSIAIPSTTPKTSATKNVFLPRLNDKEDDFATPAMSRSVNPQASIVQKIGTVAESTTAATFVTPEANVTTQQDSSMQQEHSSFRADQHDAQGFDDLLSLFLGDLRSATDLEQHGQAELLNLEVDLCRAFSRTLHDRSMAMDVLDSIEDAHLQADDLIAIMQEI